MQDRGRHSVVCLVSSSALSSIITNSCLLQGLDVTEVLEEDPGQHDVRSDADAVGEVPAVKGPNALLGRALHPAVHEALVRHDTLSVGSLVLQTRLDEIEGKRDRGSSQTTKETYAPDV